jgi:hypothetical protein
LKIACATVVALWAMACTVPGVIGIVPGSEASDLGTGCALSQPAFCDTFDAPAGVGNRSGQLDGTVWGTSRASGGGGNFGQGYADVWGTTPENECGQTAVVQPEGDINICDGHLVEATNDDGDATSLVMMVRQPFDIAGRTGTVVFDVSNDSGGTHRAWPELWFTDAPIPAPRVKDTTWNAVPKDGFGIQLAGACVANMGCGACPGTTSYARVGFSAAFVSNDYLVSTIDFDDPRVTVFDCVAQPSGPDERNHFEIHVSQNQIDVFGTDAGTTAPLKKLMTLSNAGLTLTRGFVSIEDDHLDGNLDGTDPNPPTDAQGIHTFSWDNVGFDGPRLPRDLAFDVPDSLILVDLGPGNGNGYTSLNLGWALDVLAGTSSLTLAIEGVTGIENASAGLVTFNFQMQPEGGTLTYSLNGNGPHVQPWPYPDSSGSSWRTVALPVPLSDVVTGTNTLVFTSTNNAFFANVDLVLVGAGGAP